MNARVERVVTTVTEDGKSVFTEHGPVRSADAAGLTIDNIWGTPDGIPDVGAGRDDEPVLFPFFPGPGGHRIVQVEFPPATAESAGETSAEDAAKAAEEAERNQPGLLGAFDADNPGFHITDSVDYGICLDGELWLVLDDGQERHITPGTFVVQRGTHHAWQNRSNQPCTMVFVLLGAHRT
jgi:uncharacterized cupin superfamily protein